MRGVESGGGGGGGVCMCGGGGVYVRARRWVVGWDTNLALYNCSNTTLTLCVLKRTFCLFFFVFFYYPSLWKGPGRAMPHLCGLCHARADGAVSTCTPAPLPLALHPPQVRAIAISLYHYNIIIFTGPCGCNIRSLYSQVRAIAIFELNFEDNDRRKKIILEL